MKLIKTVYNKVLDQCLEALITISGMDTLTKEQKNQYSGLIEELVEAQELKDDWEGYHWKKHLIDKTEIFCLGVLAGRA